MIRLWRTLDGQIIVSTDGEGVRAPRLQPTKTGSRRVVALSPSLVDIVSEKAAKYGEVTAWLFTSDAGPPSPDRIGWRWRRSRQLAGINKQWRLHDLGHWSATQLREHKATEPHRLTGGCGAGRVVG